jgi:oligoribonuclease
MIAFVDLETTGLDPTKESVLEVACIVTDDMLVEAARFHRVVYTELRFYQLTDFIRDMHTKNGLWNEVKGLTGIPSYELDDVNDDFGEFLEKFVTVTTDDQGRKNVDRPLLAGNTISFDRAFMKIHLPSAEAELHYRNDCSSFNEVARRFWPEIYAGRPKKPEAAHRAMDDAEESLETLRYYVSSLGVPFRATADDPVLQCRVAVTQPFESWQRKP